MMHRTVKVLEYNRRGGCGVWDAPGLTGIPAELEAQTRAAVEQVNGQLGWVRYQVVADRA